MKNHGESGIDGALVLLEPWYETGRRSRMTTKYGVYYSTESPSVLIDKASLSIACSNGQRIKATRHNLKDHKKNIILYSSNGMAAYPTRSPSDLGCVWIFNQQYTLESISPAKTRIVYKQFGISKEIDASIHYLSKQQKRLRELLF